MNDAQTTSINKNNGFNGEAFRSQLIPLFFIASIFLLNFTSRIVLAPLLPTIESNLRLSHGNAGSLFLFLSMGYFLSLLGSGHISSRISHQKTIAFSAIAVGTALSAISLSKNLFTMQCCVFLLGISSDPTSFFLSALHPGGENRCDPLQENRSDDACQKNERRSNDENRLKAPGI